ncbi:MAG: DUF4332 domain-containing protein [Tenuifilaceae bacterium]|jgi:hypothetical protein|nr:DUF4332 domain-containing protein [Tenuifilaceae bacterium]
MMLKERLDERFGQFKSMGIRNVKELLLLLKRKETLTELSAVECLAGDYLIILLRELNSMLPKPNSIADFTGIAPDTVDRLVRVGIKNTEKLYYRVLTHAQRTALSEVTGISIGEILELAKLSDLSRVKWVGVTFARMLYELGVDTVEKATQADPVALQAHLNQLNREKNFYKGTIGLNDIRIFVEMAKELPLEIEWE